MREAFKIIFDDECLIVLDKKVKILVQGCRQKAKNTLTSLLEQKQGKKVFPCHRLDKETTGLVIYAKDKQAQKEITRQFRQRIIKKQYTAFVRGILRKKRGVIDCEIIDSEGEKFGEKAKNAKTKYQVSKECAGYSVVNLEPLTGRTNQLRIHLAGIGHPILGESKYAFRRDFPVKFKRLALHAYSLSFQHPISGETINLKIGLPEDMDNFLADCK